MQLASTGLLRAVTNFIHGRGVAKGPTPPIAWEEAPLDLQLFNQDQLARHAEDCARRHELAPRPRRMRLLDRLADNERLLLEAHARLTQAVAAKERISPAGEWLLDNFPLIEENIRLAKRHLPASYGRQLPQLASGRAAGHPRVYDIAVEVIAHVDGRVDLHNLRGFVDAYQSRKKLNLGELWAIPIMLRLALIENLRRVAARVVVGIEHRSLAREFATRIRETAESDPKSVIIVAAEMARVGPALSNAFVAEFAQRLQDKGPYTEIPLTWIEQQLVDGGSSIAQRIQGESQQQASNQVSVGGSVGSLRFLAATDWRDFVEQTSVVEAILRSDPAEVHARMDFFSRDRYRHAVEALARRTGLDEALVAQAVDALARAGQKPRERHVGYYLIDKGRESLCARLGVTSLGGLGLSHSRRWGTFYFGVIAVAAIGAPALLLRTVVAPLPLFALLALAMVVVASQFGVQVANWLATAWKSPGALPRLDFSEGIPADCRTLVIVPTMLINPRQVEHLLDALEIRYLGNPSPELRFGLLTDFTDAATEATPEDEALLATVRRGLDQLNRRHGTARSQPFCWFHRPRVWSDGEGAWMGHERKRGKLEALNALLRGRGAAAFAEIRGDVSDFGATRYVITLDTDTQLPRDAAHKLIGTMAHPLNEPVFDGALGRVVEGYGLLQPRVAVTLPSARRSHFVRMHAGDAGTDPYTRAVSDVYQDLFGEGSFVGKGIYHVDAFSRALEPSLPENLILSHDLIEGCFARSGLVSDVILLEDHPSHFVEDVMRRRRWMRGDWQIAAWLLPRVPRRDGSWGPNPLSALSRWKIFDNLRRAAVPVAAFVLLAAGWLATDDGWLFSRAVTMFLFTVPAMATLTGLLGRPDYASVGAHFRYEMLRAGERFAHALLAATFLPNDALNSLQAGGRSLYRMLISKKHLLEWLSATDPRHTEKWGFWSFLRSLSAGPICGLGVVLLLRWKGTAAVGPAVGFALLWTGSPFVARWLSRPLAERLPELSQEEQAFLRRLSRKTWAFFEAFVGPADHWLPPDNFQETPAPVVAHRTSPTNIGLALLATLAAQDFGYLSPQRLLQRIAATFATLDRLPRFRGHFYNWYDTQTLSPLHPLYVSTVDSGNFTGHLLVLAEGLRELEVRSVPPARVREGLADTLAVALETARQLEPSPLRDELIGELEGLFASCNQPAEPLAPADELHGIARLVEARVGALVQVLPPGDARFWAENLVAQVQDTVLQPVSFDDKVSVAMEARRLAALCEEFARVDYDFLYEPTRHLLAIGYNVGDHRRDPSYYDLLASEARLVSYVAIAEGDLPEEHWFALGRLLTSFGAQTTLLSWSGSMFEYLMPLLVMPTFRETLLDHTYETVVKRQISYGRQHGVPWGISESGYHLTDTHSNYQYKAFGVPGLGFKRGLAEDLVTAPYASVMAVMVDPQATVKNLQVMHREGFEGRYGFYEAVDYTPTRLEGSETRVVLRSFMAHHQGMSLLALAYHLLDKPMQRRFLARPSFQAAQALLFERLPNVAAYYPHAREVSEAPQIVKNIEASLRVVPTPHTPVPEVHLLSNGRLSTMVTNGGSGYTRWNGLALTRWREDGTTDPYGTYLYVRDLQSGALWSAAHHPTKVETSSYEAIFPHSRAEFRRRDDGLDVHSEIIISPEDDVELRRYTITNLSDKPREIELTTYAEVVLAPQASDEAHPTFSNLFVQTEVLAQRPAILCRRRPRSDREQTPVLFHLLDVPGAGSGDWSFETDRRAFVGRARNLQRPAAFDAAAGTALSGGEGSVLDPIVAIRCKVRLGAEQAVTVHSLMGVGADREAAVALVEKFHDRHIAERIAELAWTHRGVVMRQSQISDKQAQTYMKLAGRVLFPSALLRAKASTLTKNRRGQSALWAYGISGDLPVVLLRVSSTAAIDTTEEVLRAHAFWRDLGLAVDLVIWNEDDSGYRQDLQERLLTAINVNHGTRYLDVRGGIFVRRLEQMGEDDRILMLSVARVVLSDTAGSLADQVERRARQTAPVGLLTPKLSPRQPSLAPLSRRRLRFANGVGGFNPDGDEYVIHLGDGVTTPTPWSNVLANPHFGSLVTESGGSYTWCENSHEYRLSPWSNDPVQDLGGEAFYVRDEETGSFWSPTPLPVRGPGDYEVRHGFGYSVFTHEQDKIRTELTVFVPYDAPVKVTVLKLVNRGDEPRVVSVTGYVEWVLGELKSRTGLHLLTEVDSTNGALCARNPYHPDFGGRIAFLDCSELVRTSTGDRVEFLGRNGSLLAPAALAQQKLSGKTGAALDACAAMQTTLTLAPGEERVVTFLLGVGRDQDDARTLVRRFGKSHLAEAALKETQAHWRYMLGGVEVRTPEASFDILVNGWLNYQTIASRLWGRTGFYQSGGAFGFRDQLQDTMSLVHTQPRLLREQILRCANRQYLAGDVQHWWHLPSGFGVRTHFSDDYLWLPYATSRYVRCIGDTGILDVECDYLEGREVKPDEEAYGDQPRPADEKGSLYDHCVRAIRRGLRFGRHGLPLIGCGDWNDGMNLVGERGQGESVWLAFFLCAVMEDFEPIARAYGDGPFADVCRTEADGLKARIEAEAWDGDWYLRAFFDDGEPLGSKQNAECQIDSLPQSWAILSGAGNPARAEQAMLAVERRLVDRERGVIKLFDPPFDRARPNPGYIKGYVPGVRENGGQYTHAAIWTTMAFAAMGRTDTAWELARMINPVAHGETAESMERYMAEPYVVAADVYAVEPHAGKGGWTWYTGSAGWYYRLLVESLLGLHLEVDRLRFAPRVPSGWRQFEVRYRYRNTPYEIRLQRGDAGSVLIELDGVMIEGPTLPLADDGETHRVVVTF